MKFGDATMEIALAQHSTIQAGLTDIYNKLYENDSPPYSEDEKKELLRVRALGSFDPKIITEGTLAYGITFPSGFKAVLIGSAGPITPGVKALAEKLGRSTSRSSRIRSTRSPRRRSATHGRSSNCSSRSCSCRRITTPIRRPGSISAPNRCSRRSAPTCRARTYLAPLYRSPICVSGGGADKGKVVSFKY
jgi:hypothetical protein